MDRIVGVDTPFEDVIAWDDDGDRIIFDPEPGKFRDLSEEEFRQLSSATKAIYSAMKAQNKLAERVGKNPPTPGLKVQTRYISPSDKLEVQYPPGFRDRWHTAWLRCDQDRQNRAAGYAPVTDGDVVTATPEVGAGSTKLVGDYTYQEYVLMKLPKEEWDKREAANEDVSKTRIKGADASAKEQLARVGGQPFEAEPNGRPDGRNWGPPKPS